MKIFRFGLFGSSMNALFLTMVLISLYFDFRKIALKGVIIVFSSNLLISILTIRRYPGIGFAIAFSIGTIYMLLAFKIRNLLFITYISQSSGLEKGSPVSWNPRRRKVL